MARFEHAVLALTTRQEVLDSAVAFSQRAAAEGELEREEMLGLRPCRGGHVRVEGFSVDILRVVRALGEGRDPGAPPARESIVLFSKLPGWHNVRYAAVNRRTRDLLAACDGGSTCREIVGRLLARGDAGDDDPAAFADACLDLLRRLSELNAISFSGLAS